ncbi:hypothetical protein AN0702.2 [Paecilomyces variotii No. 5]|uniref:Uncharacterized protein n=1 Tax=Byssochlamys spectabilis (strain No. 5 / NBRC 109023) TaxID=1356009 RepID=V5G6S8_BYSSN|nr:hypothetical protein AN0702.2 [Paecilomyces variotii No. 5]
MHLSKLLLTAAATLAVGPTTVYGYALAGASVRYYDYCRQDNAPADDPYDSNPIILHENRCQEVEMLPPHFGFYAVNGIPINDDARWHCDGIQVFQNGGCSGQPDFEIPFMNPHDATYGTCHPKLYGSISLRLDCHPH